MRSKVSLKRAMDRMQKIRQMQKQLAKTLGEEKEKTPPNDGVKPVGKKPTS